MLKRNNPGCICCNCFQCPEITAFTISGMTDPGYCPRCATLNGTYVFRTLANATLGATGPDVYYGLNGCLWGQYPWVTDNCGADDNPYFYYIGYLSGTPSWYLIFRPQFPVGFYVELQVSVDYYKTDASGSTLLIGIRKINASWKSALFENCADAIGATLALDSVSNILQPGSTTDPGDFCNLLGATVTLS